MKSSCGPDTKTPGCTQLVGALVAIEVPVGPVCDAVVAVVDKVDLAEVCELAEVIVVVLDVEVFVLCLASVPDVKRSIRIIVMQQMEKNFGAIAMDSVCLILQIRYQRLEKYPELEKLQTRWNERIVEGLSLYMHL